MIVHFRRIGPAQQFVFTEVGEIQDGFDARFVGGQGAGLVKADNFRLAHFFEVASALDEDAALGCCRHGRTDSRLRRQDGGARAGHDHHDGKGPPQAAGQHQGSCCGPQPHPDQSPRQMVGLGFDRRPVFQGIFHEMHDPGEIGAVAHAFGANVNDALAHIGTGKDLVAFPQVRQFSPTGDWRIVNQRFTGDDGAIDGNFLAGVQYHDVTRLDRSDRHFHLHVSGQDEGVFGGQVEDVRNRTPRAFRHPGFQGFGTALDPQDFQRCYRLRGKCRGRTAGGQKAFQRKALFPGVPDGVAEQRPGGQQGNYAQRRKGALQYRPLEHHFLDKNIEHDPAQAQEAE